MLRPCFVPEDLPNGLRPLLDLALDLRWTWSHEGDALWRTVHAELWERTRNPWMVLQDLTERRLRDLGKDAALLGELERLAAQRVNYLADPGWYGRAHPDASLRKVAYFSMEFGISEALPIYAGGLGVLAGDHLKTSSDLGVPLVGVGLLYHEGYFRQTVDAAGRQREIYPYNDATSLPIQPMMGPDGGWLRISLDFPGRTVNVRVWKATVGKVDLFLLDSNDPLNSPADRGITSKLYGGGRELRLAQEIVLGIGGWRVLEALEIPVDVCHLNEGHAALLVLERARTFMVAQGCNFREALWTTRAGNVFTTHTPVAAGFDTFPAALIDTYFAPFSIYVRKLGISAKELLGLGRRDPDDANEPFNMAYLALRGSILANGVSELHGKVSRRIFAGLFPGWPEAEVPVSHVTNGVHVPTWDSVWSDDVWTRACGKGRWLGDVEALSESIQSLSDEELWTFHCMERADLVSYARERLARHLGQRGADPDSIAEARHALDPDALTLGFARRFAEYKRPGLLLADPQRLEAILTNRDRPVQLIVAGKAHPNDDTGKRLIEEWVTFVKQPRVRRQVVFLEDYDMSLTQELVQGVDVWINVPRRPWEACGTSGMKVLANGGLNLSSLDGWWAEAHGPDVGWTLGDSQESSEGGSGTQADAADARQLYEILERQVVPEFYDRDSSGIPRAWVARMRASLSRLTPRFSSNRMVREYVERAYLPACIESSRRHAEGVDASRRFDAWQDALRDAWPHLHFGNVRVEGLEGRWEFHVEAYIGRLEPSSVSVELWADPEEEGRPGVRMPLDPVRPLAGTTGGFVFAGSVPADRPADHFTPRIVPRHPGARIPVEEAQILWQR